MADNLIDFSVLTKDAASRMFKAGETVFREGESGTEVYLVKSGEVTIRSGNRVLETVGPNGIFGEMALIDGSPRSAEAQVTADAELVPLNERQFTFLVGETPYFALNVMRVMARRLRAATVSH